MKFFTKNKFFLLILLFLAVFSFKANAGETECETSKSGICETINLLEAPGDPCPNNYIMSEIAFGCPSKDTEPAVCCLPDLSGKSTTPECQSLEGYCEFIDLNSGQTNPCINNFSPAPSAMDCPKPTHTGSKEACCAPKNVLDSIGACQKAGGTCAKNDPGEKYTTSTNEKENKDCEIQKDGKCYFLKKCYALNGTCFSGDCPTGYKNLTGSNAQTASDSCKKTAGSNEQVSCCVSEKGGPTKLKTICPEYGEGLEGGFLFFKGSLVPCGRNCDDPNTDIDETQTCTICHFIILIKRGYDLVFAMLIIVSLVTITAGGVIYVASAGNSKMTGIAKGLIVKTLIGFGLFLVVWLIIFTLLKFLSVNTSFLGDGEKWYEFECETKSIFDIGVPEKPPVITVPTPDGYTYDSGIEKQTADASNKLRELLTCMQPKLSDKAKRISSISDSQGMNNCAGDKHKRPPCAHTKNSCHYGGTKCTGQSYAVDFGDEDSYEEIKKAAQACSGEVNVIDEKDHIHVSVGRTACGCNEKYYQ